MRKIVATYKAKAQLVCVSLTQTQRGISFAKDECVENLLILTYSLTDQYILCSWFYKALVISKT